MTQENQIALPSFSTSEPTEPIALRPSQVVKRYGIPRDRLYGAIANSELRALNLGTPRRPSFLIRVSDLEAWIETLVYGGKK